MTTKGSKIDSIPIIVIAGPTASGKSQLAIKLAKEINGEIINGDSRQVYKELSIGTAKPSKKERRIVPHHLYDYISVKEDFNIYRYQKDFNKLLKSFPKKKIPILVGGSGLYIDSVIFNYELKEEKPSKKEQEKRVQLNKLSVKELQKLVSDINPKLLKKLNRSDRNNPIRLIRVIEREGEILNKKEPKKHKYFVIDIDKKLLNKKIEKRIDRMFELGLLEENKKLREQGLEKHPVLNTIGYQEFTPYFEGNRSLKEVKREIIKNTKKYSKRQKTWFRKHKHAIWTSDYNLILEESLKFIKT
ncbi:MAG: tRNA dimethylallyltransferase [candidate division WS6 bacterium 36_33]|uniref:tRNA dimethylallyltransferase n=1 Tax=candidate division WS6 bacterium 36_33 TaxID=1641388 RepID=A0A101GZI3_9BACT|nr:MAG: tRNA dimethylallyltransferase [candidate division WS6 bacterium 36_33]